ncbi:hypothetical protein KDK95_18585 [Actinospica sp. MGRD01-02]|uniref:Uncharacterized protein n=1 Tax=Actinospica acidithermotolerans TaxID=2828514 RepID=A0A941EDC2_9ACTN|nr:hypothetical protein [Actinospica acidithermotolerans]MBR7828325.1 hypothetical protein [Actinospica acidithermotolerans]
MAVPTPVDEELAVALTAAFEVCFALAVALPCGFADEVGFDDGKADRLALAFGLPNPSPPVALAAATAPPPGICGSVVSADGNPVLSPSIWMKTTTAAAAASTVDATSTIQIRPGPGVGTVRAALVCVGFEGGLPSGAIADDGAV